VRHIDDSLLWGPAVEPLSDALSQALDTGRQGRQVFPIISTHRSRSDQQAVVGQYNGLLHRGNGPDQVFQ
jgi:hypothetical protein